MKRPRVLFVDHTAALGGAELSLLDIAIAFRNEATVALFEHGPFEQRLREAGVDVEVLDHGDGLRHAKQQSGGLSPRALAAAFRLVLKLARAARGYDVIYANSPKSFLIAAAAGVLTRRRVMWHVRDILDRTHFSAANIRLLVRVANAVAARVITNSQATASAFIAAGGSARRVVVIHNGIDPAPFDRPAQSRVEARTELGVPRDAFVVGSFSRLSPWKGQQVLLEALESLPGVHALLVGGALFGESAFEGELRERASRPALLSRVRILGARNDVAELMSACDVIVHTSTAPEPFGRVIVEALLANRPLIASNGGGVPEIVQHNVTALLIEPGDAVALREAIDALRRDVPLAASLAAAGATHVRSHFLKDGMIASVRREIEAVSA